MSNVVVFDGVDLSAITGVDIYNYEFNLYPNRQLRSYKLANQNRSGLTSAEYVEKKIIVYAIARACTSEDAEEIMMNLRANTQGIKKTITVDQFNRVVDYTATLSGMTHSWVGNNLMIEMSFYCEIPIGTDTIVEDLILPADTNTTTQPTNFAITLGGSSLLQYPIITIVINSLTIGAGGEITIANSDNSFEVAISAVFVAADVVVVDTYNKLVTINTNEVEYSGRIPEFGVGTTDIIYGDDFSARDVDVTAEYQKRYV